MTEAFLGIDLGTSSVKAVVVDVEGTVRGMGSAEYPTLRPHPGWAEQDPEAWWEATAAAVRQAVGWSGAGSAIAGMGVAGQMHGAVFLGENDAPLTPAVIWADQRSARQAAEITAKLGAERLIGIAGSPLATGFMAATAAWMQEERSSIWWRTKRLLSAERTSCDDGSPGTLATDPGDGSGIVAASTPAGATGRLTSSTRSRCPSILLPPVKPSNAVAGEVTRDGG